MAELMVDKFVIARVSLHSIEYWNMNFGASLVQATQYKSQEEAQTIIDNMNPSIKNHQVLPLSWLALNAGKTMNKEQWQEVRNSILTKLEEFGIIVTVSSVFYEAIENFSVITTKETVGSKDVEKLKKIIHKLATTFNKVELSITDVINSTRHPEIWDMLFVDDNDTDE